MNVPNLLYLAHSPFGGWITFTAHLTHSLGAVGRIMRVGKTHESRLRAFGYGAAYQNVTAEALPILDPSVTIITAVKITLPNKTDYERICEHTRLFGGVVRFDYYWFDTPYWGTPGGLTDLMPDRVAVNNACAKMIAKRYPQYVSTLKYRPEGDRLEIKLRFKAKTIED